MCPNGAGTTCNHLSYSAKSGADFFCEFKYNSGIEKTNEGNRYKAESIEFPGFCKTKMKHSHGCACGSTTRAFCIEKYFGWANALPIIKSVIRNDHQPNWADDHSDNDYCQ